MAWGWCSLLDPGADIGLEQTLAVLCSDTADPRNIGDYLAACS
jgi:hypothetical protein